MQFGWVLASSVNSSTGHNRNSIMEPQERCARPPVAKASGVSRSLHCQDYSHCWCETGAQAHKKTNQSQRRQWAEKREIHRHNHNHQRTLEASCFFRPGAACSADIAHAKTGVLSLRRLQYSFCRRSPFCCRVRIRRTSRARQRERGSRTRRNPSSSRQRCK